MKRYPYTTSGGIPVPVNHPVYCFKRGAVRIWTGADDIPPVPASDGTYTLTATRSNGTVTYNWI